MVFRVTILTYDVAFSIFELETQTQLCYRIFVAVEAGKIDVGWFDDICIIYPRHQCSSKWSELIVDEVIGRVDAEYE